VMYRCTRAIPLDADLVQAQRAKDFFKEIEDPQGEFRVLAQKFDTLEAFEKLWLDNLQKLLAEYGEHSKMPITPEVAQILAPKIPNNLPRRAAFFGRAKEMDVVMRALSPDDRTWGVLVDGIGGIGKTALAVEAAHRAQEAGAFDAFVFVTAKQNILAPSGIREQTPAARTLDDFLNETARVIGQPGIPKLASDEKRRALLDALRATRALLLYDNLETLSKEEQEAMADFLRELPQGCKAIITSRRRGGEGAVWLRVERLDWEAARGIIENEMARDVGLADKLRRVKARWQELYDETNGSPLALVHTLGLMRVRGALTFDGALEMLRGNREADLQKFIFQEARKELTTNDKTALGALSFFVPSATFEAWMQVADLSRNALETTIDRLSALSLVDVLAGEERYALHPLTRVFVRDELLADANVARETGMRFARYWVDFAYRYGWFGQKKFSFLEAELANLDTSAEWLWQTSEVKEGEVGNKEASQMLQRLAIALSFASLPHQSVDADVRLNVWAYETMRALNDWRAAGSRAYVVAQEYLYHGDSEDATRWANKCAEAWARGGYKREEAEALHLRGQVAQLCKEYDIAENLFQDALAIYSDINDVDQVALVLSSLGRLKRECRQHVMAEKYFREALAICGKQNYGFWIPAMLADLGELAIERERWGEAREWFEKILSLARETNYTWSNAQAQYGLARVYEAEGRADLALPLAQEALKIYERLQHRNMAEARELVERLKGKQPPP